MSLISQFYRSYLVVIIAGSLVFGGCSYIPWINDSRGDDLAFEEDFPFEDIQDDREARNGRSNSSDEDDFFGEGSPDSLDDDFSEDNSGFEEMDDDFASIDQRTDKKEIEGDVGTLQTQQEALISKVRELEEVLSLLGPKINATQERLEGSLSAVSGQSEYLEPEVEDLKLQVARLNDEIASLTSTRMSRIKSKKKVRSTRKVTTPLEYNQALTSYRGGNYDESILQFQSFALASPPEKLKDNIAFWIGSNYVKLEMFEDAITQFEMVINSYPTGNKVHDSRYMLGVSYYMKGESSRAVEILQSALRGNPPAEVREKILNQLRKIQ